MRVKVVFTKCRHNPKRLAHNTSFRYAVLSFSLLADGKLYENLNCLVQHPHDTAESNLIVSPPATYSGPFNHAGFSSCARDYYESCSALLNDRDAPETDHDIHTTKEYEFDTET